MVQTANKIFRFIVSIKYINVINCDCPVYLSNRVSFIEKKNIFALSRYCHPISFTSSHNPPTELQRRTRKRMYGLVSPITLCLQDEVQRLWCCSLRNTRPRFAWRFKYTMILHSVDLSSHLHKCNRECEDRANNFHSA